MMKKGGHKRETDEQAEKGHTAGTKNEKKATTAKT